MDGIRLQLVWLRTGEVQGGGSDDMLLVITGTSLERTT